MTLADTLTQVREKLARFYTVEEMELWLRSPQLLLQGGIPVDLIAAERGDEVLTVVEQLEDSVYL